MGKERCEFRVIISISVNINGDSSIYTEIDTLLKTENLVKNADMYNLPENLYLGIMTKEFGIVGHKATSLEIQDEAKKISNKIFNLIESFFKKKNLTNTIFVNTSMRSMNSFVITKNKLPLL